MAWCSVYQPPLTLAACLRLIHGCMRTTDASGNTQAMRTTCGDLLAAWDQLISRPVAPRDTRVGHRHARGGHDSGILHLLEQ